MRGIRRTGASVAVVGVLLAGCSGGAPAAAPSSGAPSSEPTVSAVPTESATPTETASEVLPGNDVEDPLEALQAIWDFYDYLAAHPDPDKLELIFHPECDCYPDVHALLERLESNGQHIEVIGRELSEVELLAESTSTAEIRIRNVVSYRLVSGGGSEGEPQESDHAARWLFLLDGGRWLAREILN